MSIKTRVSIFVQQLLESWWKRTLLALWAIISFYDQLVSQILPDEWAKEMPRTWKVISVTSGLLSWQTWLIILLALVAFFSVEHTYRHSRKKSHAASNSVSTKDTLVIQSELPTISLRSSHASASGEYLKNKGMPNYFCDFMLIQNENNQTCQCGIESSEDYLHKRMAAGSLGLCVITNHSDVPLFNVKIQTIMDYFRVEDNSPSGLGNPVRHYELAIPIPNSVLKPKESAIFLFGNSSKYNALLAFSGYLIACVGNSREKVNVPYTFESDFHQQILMTPGQKEKVAWINEARNRVNR